MSLPKRFRDVKLHGLSSNSCLDQKWSKVNTEWHRKKIQGAKSNFGDIFDDETKGFGRRGGSTDVRRNAKRDLMRAQKEKEIEQQNIKLVQRMTQIIKQRRDTSTQRGARNASPDLANKKIISGKIKSHSVSALKRSYHDTSAYKNLQTSIHESNLNMLKRLQEQKSQYNVETWQEDRLKNLKNLGRIAKYDCVLLDSKDFRALPGGFNPNKSTQLKAQRNLGKDAKDLLMRLPKVSGTSKNILTNEINKIINKETSRYDEDYQIADLQKMKKNCANYESQQQINSSRSTFVSPRNNVNKSAAWAQGAPPLASKRSLSPTLRHSIDSNLVNIDNTPIEVSLAELRKVRQNMKKQRIAKRNGTEMTLTNSQRGKKPFNADVSKMSSVQMTDDQIWINAQVEHLFKVRRNKNWYFIQNSFQKQKSSRDQFGEMKYNSSDIIEEENQTITMSNKQTLNLSNIDNGHMGQRIPHSLLMNQPFDAKEFPEIPITRQVIHRQQIIVSKRFSFEIELSFEKNKFFIIVKRQIMGPLTKFEKREQKKEKVNLDLKDIGTSTKTKYYSKLLWLTQAKSLIKLFEADLNTFVSGLMKIRNISRKPNVEDFQVDFSFMDKMLTHMVGLEKQDLMELLKQHDEPQNYSIEQSIDKVSRNSSNQNYLNQPSSANESQQQQHPSSLGMVDEPSKTSIEKEGGTGREYIKIQHQTGTQQPSLTSPHQSKEDQEEPGKSQEQIDAEQL